MATAPALARSDDALIDELLDTLQRVDTLNAQAARMLEQVMSSGGVARRRGLPVELMLRLAARRTRWQARDLIGVADAVRLLPRTAVSLAQGLVSFGQMLGIARAIASLDLAGRAAVDELVARRASELASAEPEQLVWEVEDLAAGLRDDLLARREQRAVDRNFLALQPRLEGGGSLYGQADAEAFATISEALDAAAGSPEAADDADEEEPGSRARQRMDALVGICEASLAGGAAREGTSNTTTRPRPRFLVSLDLADPLGINPGARILARAAGHPVRMSWLATPDDAV